MQILERLEIVLEECYLMEDSRVVDSRTVDDGLAIRRRRECAGCGRRFTTA